MSSEIRLPEISFSPEFLQKTKQLFSKMVGYELSNEECVSVANNVIALELLLRELAVKYA